MKTFRTLSVVALSGVMIAGTALAADPSSTAQDAHSAGNAFSNAGDSIGKGFTEGWHASTKAVGKGYEKTSKAVTGAYDQTADNFKEGKSEARHSVKEKARTETDKASAAAQKAKADAKADVKDATTPEPVQVEKPEN